ncbi:efflux RND transporter periplasmic adaptor subunit [Mucilaginibacter lappiensis]|uniref:Membrane fusion protein (Multidrug efflux system) n=1 Tax=Mucilaginibacter lappiensis TaxID=354630 RepID=A0A1N7ER17_9SPHI|nr:efflux RND transporter periplasmic adaptor subunit [Mucilaginibacter lappiensis]MBB6111926.1 membrane fusion protein (multidrug efflux system) [Mucilaginibacter lappiensis]MBB6126554.1 membrane fusion protein (multidrug efflux system) [Mucilaginibacter lappiensis]SIR90506.1 membrane fusion protein, multidrug efflux system [Mucilaginibacter lappiensis]
MMLLKPFYKAYHVLLPKNWALLFTIVLSTIILSSCGSKNKQAAEGQGGEQILDYKVLTLQPRSATLNVDYPASIQGQQNIEIRPKVDGFVEKIYVDEGSIVKKGQLLFKINAPQYEQDVRTAQAGIKTAEADLSLAKMQVNKVKPLVEKDIISHYELESAEYTQQSKAAALAQAKAALVNAQVNLGYTTITSPVNGVIGALPYKLGSLVTSTTTDPLTTVYNTSNIYAYFALNEKQLLDFSKDSTGTTSFKSKLSKLPDVTLILSDGTTYEHTGRVETVNGLINTATGAANVRAGFINPRGLIRSGSSATVRIPNTIKSGLLVPQSATYELQDKRFVYLVDNKNKIKNVAIQVMDNTAGQFYVVTDGLHAGDKIVLGSANNLRDSTTIKPNPVSEASVYGNLK